MGTRYLWHTTDDLFVQTGATRSSGFGAGIVRSMVWHWAQFQAGPAGPLFLPRPLIGRISSIAFLSAPSNRFATFSPSDLTTRNTKSVSLSWRFIFRNIVTMSWFN